MEIISTNRRSFGIEICRKKNVEEFITDYVIFVYVFFLSRMSMASKVGMSMLCTKCAFALDE